MKGDRKTWEGSLGGRAMRKNGPIVRYTAEELDKMRRRGEGQSDIEAVLALTGEELEASIDHADEGDFDWSKATGELPDSSRR